MPDYVYLILTVLLCTASAWLAFLHAKIHVQKVMINQLQSEDFVRGAALNKLWKGCFNERNSRIVSRIFDRLGADGRRGSGGPGNQGPGQKAGTGEGRPETGQQRPGEQRQAVGGSVTGPVGHSIERSQNAGVSVSSVAA